MPALALPQMPQVDDQQPDPTLPKPAQPKPQAPALAGVPGGTSTTQQQQTTPQTPQAPPNPAQTADPLAFSPNIAVPQAPNVDPIPQTPNVAPITPTPPVPPTPPVQATPAAPVTPAAAPHWDDIQGAYVGADGKAMDGNAFNTTMSDATKAWTSYSPLAGLTDKQKTDYEVGQGAQGLANVGYTPKPVTGPGSVAVDAGKEDAATAAYKASHQADIDAITKQVQAGQAGAKSTYNSAIDTQNAANAAADRAKWAPAEKVSPGITQTMLGNYGDSTAKPATNVNGAQIEGPDPRAGTAPHPATGGWVDDKGVYHEPDANAPGDYLVNGRHYATQAEAIAAQTNGGKPPTPQITPATIGGASDVGGGSVVNPAHIAAITNATTGTTPSTPSNTTAQPVVPPAYNLTNTDPAHALTAQTITPDAGLDRFAIAQDKWKNYRDSTEAGFKADADTIAAQSFGRGRGVSGMNRTREGNLDLARERDLNTKESDFLNTALTGSIEDAKYKTGVAQQQQGFQSEQQKTAFDQEQAQAVLQEMLTNGAFGRAFQQQTAGYANSPEDVALILSKIFGDQSSAAGKAAAEAFANAGRNGGTGLSADEIMKLIASYQAEQGHKPTTAVNPNVENN